MFFTRKQNRASKGRHHKRSHRASKSAVALLLCVCMLFSLSNGIAYATDGEVQTGATEQTGSVDTGQTDGTEQAGGEEQTDPEQNDQNGQTDQNHEETDPADPDGQDGQGDDAGGARQQRAARAVGDMSEVLNEETTYTAYDNDTEDGEAVPDEGVLAAHTRFTVTLPKGSSFYYEDGTDATALKAGDLTLHVKRYERTTRLDEDGPETLFAFDDHKDLIDRHMQWHTGLYDEEASASTNDAQFWRMWLEDATGKEVNVKLPANEQGETAEKDEKATVVVEYLFPDGDKTGALYGLLGTRRTCVMEMGDPAIGISDQDNFINTEEHSLETSYDPEDIDKTDERYEKITYYLSGGPEGNSAFSNLIALCSMKLSNAYISNIELKEIHDGMSALDDKEADGQDKEGNDSSDSNRRVRTFDSVKYLLGATYMVRGKELKVSSLIGTLHSTLEMDPAKARFGTAELDTNYTLNGKPAWEIVYYGEDDTALYVEDPSGIWECDSNGNKKGNKTISMNDIVSGSNTKDSDGNAVSAYSTKIVCQELTAYKNIRITEAAASGTDEFPLFINVMAAKEGDIIAPSFAISVKGNKDNFTSEQNDAGDYVVSKASAENQYEIRPGSDAKKEVVTVTAAPRYNVVIKQSYDTSYIGYFNFKDGTGSDKKRDENDVKGRLTAYGITVQLFNETNWKDGDGVDQSKLAAKGMMGIELPVDGITFDMQLSGYPKQEDSFDPEELALILWDYQASRASNIVADNGDTGQWGRNLYWKGAEITRYPKGATVYNEISQKSDGTFTRSTQEVYRGGSWDLKASGDSVDSTTGKTDGNPSGDGSATKYTFTISGYDFDFDNFKTSFPDESAGSSAKLDWLSEKYIGSFSGGHIQVVQRIPEEIDADASIYAKVVVADLVEYEDDKDNTTHFSATSVGGEKATKEAATSKPTEGSTDGMGGTVDNGKRISTQVYAPGTVSKHNSFTGRDGISIASGFLGTSYWESPHYNAATYAGDAIYLWGAAQLSRNSDAVVSAYNLLQKFDSSKLEIDTSVIGKERLLYTEGNNDASWPGEEWNTTTKTPTFMTNMKLKEEAGDATFLYAADPMYPDGWNSDDKEEMKRMNAADEKDLIYYESLEELQAAGYTCIGILLEVRNAEIPAGCYPGMRVAMKIKKTLEDDDTTSTVNMIACTVNTAHMWVRDKYEHDDENDELYRNLLSNVSWKNSTVEKPNAKTPTTNFENSLSVEVTLEDGTTETKDVWKWYFGGENETTGNVTPSFKGEYGDTTTARAVFCGKNDGEDEKGPYNNFPYVKTAYEDGMQVDGTHLGGYQAGMSLLILGYKSSLDLNVTNESTNVSGGGISFSPNDGENTPLYTIENIKTALSNLEGSAEDSKTNLVVSAYVDASSDPLEIVTGGYQVKTLNKETGEEEWIDVSIKSEEPTAVRIASVEDGKEPEIIEYTIYAAYDQGKLKFYLSGVPIGKTAAPIRFHAQIGAEAKDNDSYTMWATIQGDGDMRALTEKTGNMKNISIKVNVTGGAALSKVVNRKYIDQNDTFAYTVSYENTASETMKGRLYMYDILPYNGDSRQTNYDDPDTAENPNAPSDSLAVDSISGKLVPTIEGSDLKDTDAMVYQYYSTITASALEPLINFTTNHDGMDSNRTDAQDIDQLLRNAVIGNDARGLYYVVKKAEFEAADSNHDRKVTKEEASDAGLTPCDIYTYDDSDAVVEGVQSYVTYKSDDPLGGIAIAEDSKETYGFWNVRTGAWAQAGETIGAWTEADGDNNVVNVGEKLELYKVFRWLGAINPSGNGNDLDTGDSPGGVANANHLAYATCLYGVAVNMPPNSKLYMGVTMKTEMNEATNMYGNQAHAWVSGSGRSSKQMSEQVYTYVVGREISGLVWEDLDHDGRQSTVGGKAEPLIEGVTCTLFKWDKDANNKEGGYVAVKGNEGPNGRTIAAMESGKEKTFGENEIVQTTTRSDGSYRFMDLADGDYIVVFSGAALDDFAEYGATTYQVGKSNEVDSNDGKKLEGNSLKFYNADGEEFEFYDKNSGSMKESLYYIQYSTESKVGEGSNINLFDLDQMVANAGSLRNSTQVVDHQDLGLIIDRYKLPETGGEGTLPYRVAGILLLALGAFGFCVYERKQRRYIGDVNK